MPHAALVFYVANQIAPTPNTHTSTHAHHQLPAPFPVHPLMHPCLLQPSWAYAALSERAGTPLAAKLSTGTLAWGDKWYEGTTRNPWLPELGSCGSSAGSAVAVVAGVRIRGCAALVWGCAALGWRVGPTTPGCPIEAGPGEAFPGGGGGVRCVLLGLLGSYATIAKLHIAQHKWPFAAMNRVT